MATIIPAIVVIGAIPIPFEKIVGSPNPFAVISSKRYKLNYCSQKSLTVER